MTCRSAAALLTLALGAACAHAPRPAVARPAGEARCEEALEVVRLHPAPAPRADGLRQAVTTPLSWLTVGAGYTADVAIVGGGTLVASAVVCLPVVALEGGMGGHGDLSAACIEAVARGTLEEIGLPGVGDGLSRATRTWRCPDHGRRAAEARAVAACFAERDQPGDRLAAHQLLTSLTEARAGRCLRAADRREVERALQRLAEPAPGP